MSKSPSEERFPLLLYLVDDSGLSKTNKRLYFEKGRFHGINNGATAIFAEWPNYVSTCWMASILSGLVFFMMLLLILSSTSTGRTRIPRCVHGASGALDNKTIHLVHGPHEWQDDQIDFLDQVIHAFPTYKVHLIAIRPKEMSVEREETIAVSTEVIVGPSNTIEKDEEAATSTRSVRVKKHLTARRKKRNLDKHMNNLHFSIRLGAKRLLDILMHHKKNISVQASYSMETTTQPKRRKTVEEVLLDHPEVIVENLTFDEVFYKSPLMVYTYFFPEYLKIFAVRILQLWQYGGMSFDLEEPQAVLKRDLDSASKIVVNPTEVVPSSSQLNATKPEDSFQLSDKQYLHFFDRQFQAYEILPLGVVTADDSGVHMESKTPCHAFFGEVLMQLRRVHGRPAVRDVLRESLRIFCKHSVADRRYCQTL